VFEKCRPTLWKETLGHINREPLCAFYEPINKEEDNNEAAERIKKGSKEGNIGNEVG
jgi:hypothetical protein